MKILRLIVISMTCWICFTPICAQDINYDQLFSNLQNDIPLDPNIKKGQLENGITYYVKQNSKPENRLVLRLVVNAGKLQEDENQKGLAHFAEHMCFNGTENFEKNDIVKYLQSIGVKFGADLNAYTSFDETAYFLPIPTDEEEIIEKGFQIIEDWAHNVTFEPEEIEKERGVVLEELRVRNTASRRMANDYLPVIFNNAAYEDILNSQEEIESIKNFEHDALISYYETWYRPDLMAVIAVGDLPPEEIEARIKRYFSGIKPLEDPKERKKFLLPDHEETYVEVATDKEATSSALQIYFKDDVDKIETLEDYRKSLMHQLYTGMLNIRLRELTQQANPPFINASVSYGSSGNRNKNAYSAYAGVSEDGLEQGLRAVLSEIFRVKQHGFTEGEISRYKKELLKSYEKAYNERDKTESNNYVNEFQRNYLVEEPVPGIEFEYKFANHIMEDIQLAEVNALSEDFVKDYNRVIVATSPQKEDLDIPTEDELLAILEEVEGSALAPYVDEVTDEDLIQTIPTPGSIVSVETDDTTGVTSMKLSNGMQVKLKPTDFKNDEVIFTAFSEGGTSLYDDDDYYSATFADAVVNGCGFGQYSPTDLQKVLSGKNVRVSPYITSLEEGLNGSASPDDMESMFQLIYLAYTSPNQNKELFQAYMSRLKAYFKNALENPMNYFYDKRVEFMTQNHPRGGGYPSEEEINKVEFERAFEIYKERFANAGDFNFIMVGNFTIEQVKPFIETYLASLPAHPDKEKWKDVGIRPPKGVATKNIYKGSDPKSMVYVYFHGEYGFDRQTNYHLNSVAEALEIKLIEILREDQSGVYSTGVSARTEKMPYENYQLVVAFPCAPENVEKLTNTAYDEIRKIQKDGVIEADMTKVKETQRRDMEVNLKENGFWRSVIKNSIKYSWDIQSVIDYEPRIEALTSRDLKKAAKKYFNFDERAKVVLYPVSEKSDGDGD